MSRRRYDLIELAAGLGIGVTIFLIGYGVGGGWWS